jgi:hypothetical protein
MKETNLGIPEDTAIQLCTQIRRQHHGKWTFAGMQCMGCNAVSQDDVTKRCMSNALGHRGCNLVNARYGREAKSAP